MPVAAAVARERRDAKRQDRAAVTRPKRKNGTGCNLLDEVAKVARERATRPLLVDKLLTELTPDMAAEVRRVLASGSVLI